MISQRWVWLCLAAAATEVAFADPLTIERVNVNPDTSVQADGISDSPSLSADGGVVAFVSKSGTLADPKFNLTVNSPAQIYAFDRNKKSLELISVSSDGTEASDGDCSAPQVSGDGLFVAFVCTASNLPKSGTEASNNTIYIRDRAGGATFVPMYDWPVAPLAFSGAANPAYLRRYMSSDVSRISFESAGALFSVLVYLNQSTQSSALTQMCQPSSCIGPEISSDGNRIAFTTGSTTLDGGDLNAHADVYVYDVNADTYSLVSLNSDKSQGNNDVADGDIALSGDGALIAFSSGQADNFAGSGVANALVLRNIDAGTLTAVSVNDGGGAVLPVLMPRPALSDEGIVLAFTSNNTALAPHPNKAPADALVRNMKADLLRSMCRSRSGTYGNNTCFSATVSADGLWGAFTATADNLVPDDTNSQQDIFVVSLDVLFDDIFADGYEP
jgi:hypothetical protein